MKGYREKSQITKSQISLSKQSLKDYGWYSFKLCWLALILGEKITIRVLQDYMSIDYSPVRVLQHASKAKTMYSLNLLNTYSYHMTLQYVYD